MLKSPRLDAIVYRTGGSHPCYISEHDCSMARDEDFYRSLSKLRSQVRSDLSSGFYHPDRFEYLRTFVMCVDTVLPLRDGDWKQSFLGCSYESMDNNGHKEFISMCPTNYLSNAGGALMDSFKALGEVIEARYLDEGMTDLIRELPKAPLVTTFNLGESEGRPQEVSAVISRNNGSFEAFSPELPFTSKAGDPYKALEGLEHILSARASDARGHLLRADPIFGPVDVQLSLNGSSFIKRFLISVSPCKNGTKYYRAYAPQAGIATKSPTVEGTLENIKEAIVLKFKNAPLEDVEQALKARPILTTARISPENNN